MRILIAEEYYKSRGYYTNITLSKKLNKLGYKTRVCMMGTDLKIQLQIFKPHIVLLPSLSAKYYSYIKRYLPTTFVINIFHEQDNLFSGNTEDRREHELIISDLILTWNDNVIKNIQNSLISKKCINIGIYKYENYFIKKKRESSNTSIKKIFIPLDNSLGYKDLNDQQIKYFGIKRLQSDFNYNKKLYPLITKLIKDGYTIKIKPHPGTPINKLKKDLIKYDLNFNKLVTFENVEKMTLESDLVISRFSTALIESILLKKPVIFIYTNTLIEKYKKFYHVSRAIKKGYHANSFNDLKSVLKQKKSLKDYDYYYNLCFQGNKSPISHVVSIIQNIKLGKDFKIFTNNLQLSIQFLKHNLRKLKYIILLSKDFGVEVSKKDLK